MIHETILKNIVFVLTYEYDSRLDYCFLFISRVSRKRIMWLAALPGTSYDSNAAYWPTVQLPKPLLIAYWVMTPVNLAYRLNSLLRYLV